MKFDISLIGERVISIFGKQGTITRVEDDGKVSVEFDGEYRESGYLYCPFFTGDLKFEKTELQEQIDKIIEEQEKEELELVNSLLATKKSQERYYITLDNEDGTREVVYRLKSNRKNAFIVFGYAVKQQQKEYRKPENKKRWRVVRMFDSKTNEQICQES